MDLRTTSRETLLEVIAKQQTIIAELAGRVKEWRPVRVLAARLQGCRAISRAPRGVSRRERDRGSVVSTALPGSEWNPRGRWCMLWSRAPSVGRAWQGDGYSGLVRSSSFRWFRRRWSSTSSWLECVGYAGNGGCPVVRCRDWQWGLGALVSTLRA